MRKALVIILVIFGVLGLGELYLYLFKYEKLKNLERPNPYQVDSVINYSFIPDTDYVYKPTGNRFHFNKHGYIGEDFPEKNPDIFRITVTGDSHTAGQVLSPYYTTFCVELQKLFDRAGYRVEVFNCSVDGAGRGYDQFKSIRYKVMGMEPDMVLLQYNFPLFSQNIVREGYGNYRLDYPFGNDSIRLKEMEMADRVTKWEPFLRFLYPLHLTRGLIRKLYSWDKESYWSKFTQLYATKRIQLRHESNEILFSPEESAQMILALKEDLLASNARFFLYTMYEFETENARDTAKKYGLPLIPINVNLDWVEDYFSEKDHHPNLQGNEKLAKKLFDLFVTHGLIPEKFHPDSIRETPIPASI